MVSLKRVTSKTKFLFISLKAITVKIKCFKISFYLVNISVMHVYVNKLIDVRNFDSYKYVHVIFDKNISGGGGGGGVFLSLK